MLTIRTMEPLMQADVVKQVRTAEKRAEDHLRETQTQGETILHDARHQAVNLRLEIIEAARVNAKELLETGTESCEAEMSKIRQAYLAQIAQDTERARQRLPDVVNFVVNTFRTRSGLETVT